MGHNRFTEAGLRSSSCNRLHAPATSQGRWGGAWARPAAAQQRVLVALVENGGTDLGIPRLVDGAVRAVPGLSSVVSDDVRGAVVARLRAWLEQLTDTALEEAELGLNRYAAASPSLYGTVTVLRGSSATFADLKAALFAATRAGSVVDLLVLTHGSEGSIAAGTGIDAARIRSMRAEFGGPLNLRSVYMMSCVGGSLNQAWLDVGARTSAGTQGDNNLPEPTTHFFWTAWKAGQPFETAVTGAYRRTVEAINSALRAALAAVSPLAASVLGDAIDVSGLDVIASSRPDVVGAGSLTVASDTLPPAATSTGQALVTTVLPARTLARLAPLASAWSLAAPRALSAEGRLFVERWERPLVGTGPGADADLAARVAAAERVLAEQVEPTAPVALTQQQVDALVCFGCGVGATAFAGSSVLRLVAQGRLAAVPEEIRRWTRVRRDGAVVEDPGLRQRREAEAALFAGTATADAWAAVPSSHEVRQWSRQQNPGVLAGIAVADAIQIGLGAASLVQSGVQAFPSGSLQVSYDKQQRLLTPEARLQMPGAARPKHSYTRRLFWFPQIRAGGAEAVLTLSWEGNDYGEVSTPVVSRDFSQTSDWSRSSASLALTAVNRIPVGDDPRSWPLWYHYEGAFDPLGNGQWEFAGDVEINAFGGIRFHDHRVVSRSLLDAALDVHPDRWKGDDVVATAPALPADQLAYLRAHVPA